MSSSQKANKLKPYCEAGDLVVSLDSGVLYSAKVLRVHHIGGISKYFIHYQGWHRKYDSWVDESMIAKPEDCAKQDIIKAGIIPGGDKISKVSSSKGKKGSIKEEPNDLPVEAAEVKVATTNVSSATCSSTEEGKGGKRKVEPSEQESIRRHRRRLLQMDLVDEDDDFFVSKLPIPTQLKKHLTDEWRIITTTQDNGGRLLKLPKTAENTVDHIVKAFLEQKIPKLEKDKLQIQAYQGLMDGLLVHFDKALPSILLYRQERAQYDALSIVNLKKSPSQLYGAEHLIRLFMRMPKLLSNVCLPAADVNQILQKLGELMKFVAKGDYVDSKHYVSIEEAMSEFPKDLTDGSIQNV